MNIQQLKSLNEGVEVKGFPLLIKTARTTFQDSDLNWWQDVVFMDSSGEMLGMILIEAGEDEDRQHETTGVAARWRSKQNVCIMDGKIQTTDHNGKGQNKLVVIECFDTATPLTMTQQEDISAEQWAKQHENETKSKVRCWIVSACMEHESHIVNQKFKDWINELVDFILTGE